MKIAAVHLVYFSPCGHTLEYGRQMTYAIRQCLPGAEYKEWDITPQAEQDTRLSFGPQELALLCAPVYGGRLPFPAIGRFTNLAGRQTPAILLVTYGNRDFDDALLELTTIARNQGFWPIGGAACIAQHTLAASCAQGRPNAEDEASARKFAASLASSLGADEIDPSGSLDVPGNPQFRAYKPADLPQKVGHNCVMCGACWKNCPTGSIMAGYPAQIDSSVCIACMGCINICPAGARIPSEEFLDAVQKRIATLCETPKKNAYFALFK